MPVINQLIMLKQTPKQPLDLQAHYQNVNLIIWPMKKRFQHLFIKKNKKKNDGLIVGMRMFLSAYTDALIFRSFKFQNLSKQIFVLVWIGIVLEFCPKMSIQARITKIMRRRRNGGWLTEMRVAEERLQVINLITCAQIQSQWLKSVQTSTNIKANRSIHAYSSPITDSLSVSHQICV